VNGPLIVQSDRTVLLEVGHDQATDARHALAVFAELERAPEHIHTYRITKLGLWNARAAGHTAEEMLATLETYSKFPVPQVVATDIADTVSRYGRIVVERDADGLYLEAQTPQILAEVVRTTKLTPLLGAVTSETVRSTQRLGARNRQTGTSRYRLARRRPCRIHRGTPMSVALDNASWQLRSYPARGYRPV